MFWIYSPERSLQQRSDESAFFGQKGFCAEQAGVVYQHECLIMARAGSRIRTDDLLITNQLLYQLSYAGIYEGE
jgi:hypothetical protein